MTDPQADEAPDDSTRRAVKSYSFLAINCFLITLGAIGVLLAYLLLTETYDQGVRNIMTNTCIIIALLIAIYAVYRVADARKSIKAGA